jgi:CHAD domain-containing protein
MKDPALLKYYRKQSSSFRKNFTHTYIKAGSEDIHQLRVDIKKLRVILHIAERTSGKKFRKKKHFKLFSGLFSIAGKVREFHMNTALAKQYDQDNRIGLIEELRSGLKATYPELQNALEKFHFKKLRTLDDNLYSVRHELQNKLVISSSLRYIADRIKMIKLSADKNCINNDLHAARKRVRSINEAAGIIIRINKKYFPEHSMMMLKSLQEELGRWHDLVIFEKCLNNSSVSRSITDKEPHFNMIMEDLSADIESAAIRACEQLGKIEQIKYLPTELLNVSN